MRFAARPAVLLSAVFALIGPAGASAQQPGGRGAAAPTPAAAAPATPVATAARRSGAIAIDGRLDEPAWSAAPEIGPLTQREPREGSAPTERTVVRILFDDDALYIGARMFDSRGAAGVVRRLARRDSDPNSDAFKVELDPYHDRLHYVEFAVNPAGVRADLLDGDASWDPVWDAAATVDSLGWTAELRIPFSQLHFSRDSLQTWGLEVQRFIQRRNETDVWSFVPLNRNIEPASYGLLQGLRFARQPGHLELLPYVAAQTERLSSGDPASPFYAPHHSSARVGGDLRYPITSNLTLSATVNPDFGQVEVDPAVVNLSAFETFFSEKRPFFVEGANLFDFGQPGCNINCGFGLFTFYSRRIGRPPQAASVATSLGGYADVPSNTTILGAAKITGRTAHGTSVGLLDAVSGTEHARVVTAAGDRLEPLVQPLTNAFVGRIQHELRGGNLRLGAIGTSLRRDLPDPAIRAVLPSGAELLGADGALFWARHTYLLYAAVVGSRVAGDTAAINSVQRSSVRYFQRPDRSAGTYDPTATSLRGLGAIARLAKVAGDWLWDLNASTITPGFEANDLGFVQRADWSWLNGTFGRQFTRPTRYYRSVTAMIGGEHSWNYASDVTQRDLSSFLSVVLPNYWHFSLFGERMGSFLDDRLTRGGPIVDRSGGRVLSVNAGTDARRRFALSLNGIVERDDDGAFDRSISATLTFQPASNASLSLGPSFERLRATDQYVTSTPDPTATAFFGQRYVFSHLDETTASMTVRANVTFTPDLSLDVYAQPLIVSGEYRDFEEFAAPRQSRKLVYGRDVGSIAATGSGYRIDPDGGGPAAPFTIANPDFNFRSLRGTAVLRWEWHPGSTLYLAWTQTRAGAAPLGNFDFPRDRTALFREPPDNILLLKVSYWLGL